MFCTLQTPQASVSMLNVKIHDKISKMPQIACSGEGATQKHLFHFEDVFCQNRRLHYIRF